MKFIRISRRAAARVNAGHPWIFKSDLIEVGDARGGEVVTVVCGQTLGIAHYSDSSQIALRILSQNIEEVGEKFFLNRLQTAFDFRMSTFALLGEPALDTYRLIYAEADSLPGLIVDRYGSYLVLQAMNQGMERCTSDIVAGLTGLFKPAGILARNDSPVRTREDLPLEKRVLSGTIPDTVEIFVNGFKLRADLTHGMKTGIFLDQRENYVAAARHGRGRALDCFTSTGGFALHLAKRCERVDALDSSAAAIETARANAAANGIANIDFRETDVFQALAGFAAGHRRFDTIVLDPPAFAKSRSHKEAAARAYKDLNRRALNLLSPGGILVTCSCSHHVSEADFLEAVAEASIETGRKLRILERRTQASDHPILLTVPETMYLKCLVFQDTGL
ncbi:class I SAM-dependent rRNA methyltransferase [Nevskia soli]|uniref:class I SAM-dependent rRNA methyltransferase n=1 Tax=Nevskia soli TaxID=418856 RepID=UPI0015D8B604|nr:class I SAM-dependent rRNA methyltransferase [Nevskia soli]